MKINEDTVQLILIGVLVCAILYMVISNRGGACRLMNRRERLSMPSEENDEDDLSKIKHSAMGDLSRFTHLMKKRVGEKAHDMREKAHNGIQRFERMAERGLDQEENSDESRPSHAGAMSLTNTRNRECSYHLNKAMSACVQ